MLALPCYCAFQLISLPLNLIRSFSPARAQLTEALKPILPEIGKVPLAVNPPMGVLWEFSLLGYLAIFFWVRELGWRFQSRPWVPVLPLIILGALEAVIGITGLSDNGLSADISGTYTNRDHFSGMLEMIFPLAVMCGWAILRTDRKEGGLPLRPAVLVCVVWGMGILVFAGILASLSRMGFLAALASLFTVCALSVGPRIQSRKWRLSLVGSLVAATLILLVFLPPVELMERFADLSESKTLTGDTRIHLSRETLSLIGEFHWFGTGVGGYESTFLKYQRVSNFFRVQMAHDDYLQYLAELGGVGFALLVLAGLSVLIPMAKGIFRGSDENRRLLLVGCAGSFAAIGLHSLVDFNLHIPANTMILAWIAGIASINSEVHF
jgi:hypothetical protein